jgi:hypothetical protein
MASCVSERTGLGAILHISLNTTPPVQRANQDMNCYARETKKTCEIGAELRCNKLHAKVWSALE